MTPAGDLNIHMVNGDEKPRRLAWHYLRTDTNLDPNFGTLGAFEIDLPEGTVVSETYNPMLKYDYVGGDLIPR